ncbi:MAG: serine/threonine protein phosphatase [Desulfobulbaceae bacterium]|nr:MAG: serine/threonine protein phosphatase [Desulfobulbaceae bacterium]
MKDPLHKILIPIRETQNIRGVELPVGLEFRQLIVTGPPGVGKSYYINQIKGWPNEGYIDLTQRRWWKNQNLIYRPREIHLGIPYKGFSEALTVFDQEWLDTNDEELAIEYNRIRFPPRGLAFLESNWIDRYIFEFLLPDPKLVYKWRQERQKTGYFPVDANLSVEMVSRQIDAYAKLALYLYRGGMHIYIRRSITEPPLLISEKGDIALPLWAVSKTTANRSLTSLKRWQQIFTMNETIPWFTITDELQQIAEAARISHDGKSFDLIFGRTHLRMIPEIPLGASKKYLRQHKNWIIRPPENCNSKSMTAFARIKPGETVVIGRANKAYSALFNFKKHVAKRHLSISNIRGDLVITPLEPEYSVKIIRMDDQDNREQLSTHRMLAMKKARSLFGGKIELLNQRSALSLLLEVNEILADEPYRPQNHRGEPGGLVELPDDKIPIIIGDLHGQVNNLLKIITENCILKALVKNRVHLCILGDAVHSEVAGEMEDMEYSALIMDLIFLLKRKFPANVFYLKGNHDSFSDDLAKNGVLQGLIMKQFLQKTRGSGYVEAMQTFYQRIPYMIRSDSFIACHAGPPRVGTTREQLINITDHPQTAKEVTRTRPKLPHNLSGYGKSEIKALRKVLKAVKSTPFIAGHTPLDPFGSVWQNVSSIKNHHIICSSHQHGPAYFIRIKGAMVPLTSTYEPLLKLINKMK